MTFFVLNLAEGLTFVKKELRLLPLSLIHIKASSLSQSAFAKPTVGECINLAHFHVGCPVFGCPGCQGLQNYILYKLYKTNIL